MFHSGGTVYILASLHDQVSSEVMSFAPGDTYLDVLPQMILTWTTHMDKGLTVSAHHCEIVFCAWSQGGSGSLSTPLVTQVLKTVDR